MSGGTLGALLRERCQFENSIYRYAPGLGPLRALKRAARRLPDRFSPHVGEGKPSRFGVGDYVRVRDVPAVRTTLDARGTLRGLEFTGPQWAYCDKTFRVQSVVTRMMNDAGRMRRVARTVTLEGVTCDGPGRDAGCGRACPLLFRDEWLEPSTADVAEPAEPAARYATVKPVAEIAASLDRAGRRDGVMFAPAMNAYAGRRYAVHKRVEAVAATFWRRPRGEWYVLEGVRCLGEVLNGESPCHRGCGLLWHRDWLDFE